MTGPLDLDTYVIGRPDKFSLTVAYGCYDKDGTKLFDVKKKFIGEEYQMLDPAGKVVGVIHRKMISVTPTYDLYDGNKQLIGKVVEELGIVTSLTGGAKKFVLEDEKGNKVANVSITSPLAVLTEVLQGQTSNINTSFNVMNADGSVNIAKISRQVPQGTGTMLMHMANFVLQITDKSVSTLALVEFAIAVDHLYSSSSTTHNSMQGSNFGGIGPGGFGGGGMNIKL